MNRVLALSLVVVATAGCGSDGSQHELGFFERLRAGTYEHEAPHATRDVVSSGERRVCEGPIECSRACAVDVATMQTDCDIDIVAGTMAIDLANHEGLTVRASLTEPQGFTFHLGDSPSGNGHGGDAGDFSNDAELHLIDNNLWVYGNDYSLDAPNRVRKFRNIMPPAGGVLEFTLTDGELSVRVDNDEDEPMCVVETSADLLRLDADDLEGEPNRLWYMGLNQVLVGDRTGSGLDRVELCFH